jgi:hypothetical protein
MKARCSNPSVRGYARYGGRGIRVCDAWMTYPAFRDWALTAGYQQGLSVDRIDGDGDYCPENCRWVDAQQQANNISTNHILEAFGGRKTLADWSRDERCAVTLKALKGRIHRGWPAELALTAPRYAWLHTENNRTAQHSATCTCPGCEWRREH